MNELKEKISKELTSEQILNDLITYKEVVKKFSKTNGLTPYQLLLLSLLTNDSTYFESIDPIT